MMDRLPSTPARPEDHGTQSTFGLLFGPDYCGTPVSMGGHQNDHFEENDIDNETQGVLRLIDESNFLRQRNEQFVEKDITLEGNDGRHQIDVNIFGSQGNNQVVENNIRNQSNGGTHFASENNSHTPVLPGASGEGLPYAPIDWPNPGDNWTWRVGKRITGSGYFQDRFLYPPKHLQAKRKQAFGSRASVENYIRSEFPGTDVDALFASFSWKIPAEIEPLTAAEAYPLPVENLPQDETQKAEEKEVFFNSGRKKRKQIIPIRPKIVEENKKKTKTPRSSERKRKQNEPASSSTPSRKTRHSKRSTPSATNDKGGTTTSEPIVNLIPEDFDNYLSSLDDILAQPASDASDAPVSCSATPDSPLAESEMAKARSKLSSLLELDFPSLVLSRNISQVTALATKLRKDPRMSAEQLVKLKLIEEIPLFSEVFLESRETTQQVDKFFGALEANKAKVASLKNEYNTLKEKADHLQAEVDSSSLTVQEIDDRIAQLQSWRAELTHAIRTKKAAKLEVTSTQGMVANAIPTVVHEIQVAKSKIPEWELKRTNAAKREAEILEKFAPLRGFSV